MIHPSEVADRRVETDGEATRSNGFVLHTAYTHKDRCIVTSIQTHAWYLRGISLSLLLADTMRQKQSDVLPGF